MLTWLEHYWWAIVLGCEALLRAALCFRVIIRRTPVPDTLAWLVLLLLLPVGSWVLYVLIGENRLGTRRARRFAAISKEIERRAVALWRASSADPLVATSPMSRLLERMSGFPGVRAHSLDLLSDAEDFLSRLIADIDASTRHVHLLYYIWDEDRKGRRLADAVERAARRGVPCRVLVDAVGSKTFLAGETAQRLRSAGVKLVGALPVNPVRALFARIDLRNHRKIAIIDHTIAYCGSQNITEENFRKRIGSSAGPWLDATVRLTGPAALALQAVFVSDWLLDSDEDHTDLEALVEKEQITFPSAPQAALAHLVPSGPGPRPDAIHQCFLAMLYDARRQIVITTPYFVPDEATKAALLNAAYRGVAVTIVVPKVSDSLIVVAASRSHFADLLEAGVQVREHTQGLLHAKSATIDDRLAVIGSANFDQRSFWLNFEATLFIQDEGFTDTLRFLQKTYMAQSVAVELTTWRKRPLLRRFVDNCAQLLGPLL